MLINIEVYIIITHENINIFKLKLILSNSQIFKNSQFWAIFKVIRNFLEKYSKYT